MDLKLPITNKTLAAIISGESDEFYLDINSKWTKKLFTNPKKMYVIGIGWTNYTIHKDADDFAKFRDMGTDEDVHYMKRDLDNIREDGKLNPFTTVTFSDRKNNKYTFEFKGFSVDEPKNGAWNKPHKYVFVLKLGKQIN